MKTKIHSYRTVVLTVSALAVLAGPARIHAQEHGGHAHPPGHEGMDHGASPGDPGRVGDSETFLLGQSSGTVFQPSAWPMPMVMTRARDWRLMWMGQAFLVNTQQSGPRGGDKWYSPNWGMLSAVHRVGKGSFMLRSMLSLDPATVTDRRYPLLFQTGESAFGRPIVDGQHPHELMMELSVQYARSVGERAVANLYYAPVGDAALGPIAYPHRASAMEIPQAALGHHWQDSTHIVNNVITGGFSFSRVRIEASGFRGREPNENRWNIDMGAMDSWSTRLSIFPSANWSAQISGGHLTDPESTHPGSVDRVTASLHHVLPRPGANYWATSLIWGYNRRAEEGRSTHAVLAETVVPFARRNFVTGRFEWSQRDELFENDHHMGEELEHETGEHAFGVSAFTAGYTRDLGVFGNAQTGVGVNVTSYVIDSALKPYYGQRPWGVNFFLRVRLKKGA